MIDPSFGATPMLACEYVGENGSAAMLAAKRSAGVAPEMNLNVHHICLCQVRKRLPTLVLKPRVDVTEVQNWGISGPPKGYVSTKFFFKKVDM